MICVFLLVSVKRGCLVSAIATWYASGCSFLSVCIYHPVDWRLCEGGQKMGKYRTVCGNMGVGFAAFMTGLIDMCGAAFWLPGLISIGMVSLFHGF